ncbi:MAG: phosphatase PAP2 family protein [Gammaproteobacteria bacterium]|nr:phosphatase PAP2 family protein [Gammaproteobacteria bacterium]
MHRFFWNSLHQNYYLDFQWIAGVPGALFIIASVLIYTTTIFTQEFYPKTTLICKSISMLYISLSIMETANTAIFTTPFPTHDYLIRHLDRMIGFHLTPILQITHDHPKYDNFVLPFYFSIFFFIHSLPVALAIIENKKAMYHYYCSFLLCIIIGYLAYYFFPTMTSPAAIYPHIFFTAFQLNTLHQFQLEHLHRIIHFNLVGGIVSFPSYHAAWATLIVYFLWPYAKYFALIYGVILLLATLATGWHYFFDILGGIFIAFISIELSQWLLYRGQHTPF